MATVTNDIVTRFAFEGNLNPLGDFNSQMGGAVTFIAAMGAALAGASVAISKWATDISASQDALGQLARNTKVSVEFLGELSYAAEQSGSSAGALQSSISSLSQKIGEASISGSEDFARIGISVRDASGRIKTADQVFMEFAGRVKGLSQQQTQDFASRLGVDESLVQLLKKSSSEINQLRSRAVELGRTTTEQSDSMLAYNDSINTLNHAYEGLKVQLAVGLIPQLQKLSEGMTTWLVESGQAVIEIFKQVLEFALIMAESFKRMAPVLLLVAGGFIAMKIAAIGLTGVLSILGKLPIILALTGLYLIVDDLMTAFNGGQSVISDFYEKLSGGRSVVEDLTAAWDVFMIGIKQIWTTLSKIGEAFVFVGEKIGQLFNYLSDGKGVMNDLSSVFDLFLEKIKPVWDILSKIAGAVTSIGSASIDFVSGFFGGDDDGMAKNTLAPSMNGMYSQNQGMMGATVNNNTTIEIRTNDPVRAGQEVANALSRQTEDAYIQSGVSPR